MRPVGGGNPNLDMTGGGMICGACLIPGSIAHCSETSGGTSRAAQGQRKRRVCGVTFLSSLRRCVGIRVSPLIFPDDSAARPGQSAGGGFHAQRARDEPAVH